LLLRGCITLTPKSLNVEDLCMASNDTGFVFGGSSLGGLYQEVSFEDAVEALRTAIDGGIRDVDTAPHYGTGSAEVVLGRALGVLDAKVMRITTKVGRYMIPATLAPEYQVRVEWSNAALNPDCVFTGADSSVVPVLDYTLAGFERSHRDSLERLGIARVHGLRIHDCDNEQRLHELSTGGGIEFLSRLRSDGIVSELGTGCNDVGYTLRVMQLMPVVDSVLIANNWNLIDHPVEILELFSECKRRGAEVLLAGVFASGILAAAPSSARSSSHYQYSSRVPLEVLSCVESWSSLASKHGLDLGQVALAFARLPGHRIVLGLRNKREVEDALCWSRLQKPGDFMALWREALNLGLLQEHVRSFLPVELI